MSRNMDQDYDFKYECRRLVEQMEPRPFKTFRTEFNISSSTEHSTSYSSTTHYSSQSQYIQQTKSSKQENGKHTHTVTITKDGAPVTKRSKFDSDITDNLSNGKQDKLYTTTTHITQNEPTHRGSSMQFTEIRSLKRIHKVNEGIGTEDIINTPGIVHPVTGEILTVGDAIAMRILDVRTGRIVASRDGTTVSIDEAVQKRLMDPKLAEKLAGPCGITEDGRDVSLLEAIQRELYDAEHGFDSSSESRVKVITSTSSSTGTSIAEAIDKGRVDTTQGTYTLDNGDTISVKDAYQKGYLTYTEVKIKTNAITLHDALAQGLVDERTGWIVDRNSGNKYQIDAAIKHDLINGDIREIVDPRTDNKITLREAIDKKIINPKLGKYVNVHEKLPLMEAKRRQLIVKPMTLKDVCDKNLYDESNKIYSPLHSSKLSILEAISRAVLDCDTIKSVTNTKTNELLTLSESMADGIISPEGTFKDALTGEVCTIPIAVDRGLISSVAQKSIFDIDGFKNPDTGEFISYNTASAMGLISKQSGGSLVTDMKTGKLIPLREASGTGIVQQQIFDMLDRPIGIFEDGKELTVLEAVFRGYIDPKSGNLIDPHSRKYIPVNDAVKSNFITPDGAALLNSLLAINITSQTISKIVKRYCTVTTTGVTHQEMKMTFGEAVRRGLIDETTQTFKDPDTNQQISIQQALNEGILGTTTSSEEDLLSPTHGTGTVPKVIKRVHKGSPVKTVKIIKRESMEIDPNTFSRPQSMEVDPSFKVSWNQHDPKKSTDDFISSERQQSALEKQVFELPSEGWSLAEAIDQRLFDPVTGLFIIPGTDRLVSFEECVKLQIINPNSALVVDPKNSRKVSLIRGLDILDSTGHYKIDGKLITMKESIERQLVILQGTAETRQINDNQRLIQITKVSGKPDLVEVSNVLDKNPPTFTKVKSADSETSSLEPLQVLPGVIYDPSTALVIFTESGKSENLFDAVKDKKINPELVQVKDPYTGKEMNVNDAIKKGIINKDTGEYKDKSGRKLSLNDAAKFGVLSLIGAPLVAAAGVVNIIRNAMVVDPKTGEQIPMEVAYERGLVDDDTFKKYEAQAIISQVSSPESPERNLIKSKTEITSTSIIIKDPKTGQDLTPEQAVQQGLITRSQLESLAKPGTKVNVQVMDTTTIPLDDENRPSAGEITRGRITTEPKFKVSIGRARSLSQSPEREAKPVVLQKMRKKVIKPKDAVEKGMIDKATADILEKPENFITADGETLNLQEAISSNKLDGNKGAIVDPQRGDVVTINEAISRGILDPAGTNQILVPLNRSLSVPQLVEQGLIEPENCKIVHPETGSHLTLHEAIVCDIVDPLSKLVEPSGKKVTLQQAIQKGDIDDDNSIVKTKHGNVDLITAVERKVFDEPKDNKSTIAGEIPPTGMTFTVALQRGLIDSNKKEIVHPITGVRKPIETAIKENFIMAIPYPLSPDAIDIDKALSMNLIDSEKGIFTNPKTGDILPIKEAVETGLLIIKPMHGLVTFDPCETHTSITETITSYHTITTKTVELRSGYALLSTKEVQDLQTGEVIPIDVARERGIVIDENISKDKFTTREIKMSFSDALKKGLVDMKAGTYTDPKSGHEMPISIALKEGILDDASDIVEPMEVDGVISQVKTTEMTIMEAFETIYDEKTKKFKDPNSPDKLITFEEALDKNIIDPNAIIYDTEKNQPLTVKQAVDTGLINPKSGEIKATKTGSSVNVKEAAKLGLLAIVGAPVLAGMAAVEAVKKLANKKPKEDKKPKDDKKPIKATEPKFVEKHSDEVIITEISKPKMTRIPTIEIDEVENEPVEEMETEQNYERLPIGDAIQQRKIEPKICRITMGKEELPYTVQDGLNHNEISPLDLVDVINRTHVSLVQERPKFTITITRHLTPKDLAEVGCYDLSTKQFIDPNTGNSISFQDLLYSLEIFDPDNILVKDLNSNPAVFVPMAEALERPLIDRNTGNMVDPKTGKRISFFEAIKLGWIIERKENPMRNDPMLSLENAIQTGVLNPSTVEVKDPSTDDKITLFEAINSNIISPDSIAIRNPKSNEIVPFSQAVDTGVVNINKGVIVNVETRHEIEFSVAFLEGYLLSSIRKPISLVAVIQKGLYEPQTCTIFDPITQQQLKIRESVDRGITDPIISECTDTKADKKLNLNDSLAVALINPQTGKFKDTKQGNVYTLDVALNKGFLTTKDLKLTLVEAIIKEYYSGETGRILNPMTGDEITLHNAIKSGFIDVSTTKLKNDKKKKVVTFKEASDTGLVDTDKGLLLYPTMPLNEALAKGYILSTIKPYSLPEALALNIYDPKTGLLTIDDQKITLLEAIQKCLINSDCLTVKDPRTGEMITLTEAIKEGIIDPKTGKAVDPSNGNEINLYDALERGLIIPSKRKFSLPEAVFKGFYDPQSGQFSNPQSPVKLQTDRAIKKGFIDPQSTLVNINNTITTFEKAVDDGIIDTKHGIVKDRNRELDFQEAFEQGLFIEARKPMSLSEALVKGLFDPATCLFLDPQSGEYLTLKEAIANNIIDSDSVHVKDTKSDGWKQLSLVDALRLGYVNPETANVKDFTKGSNVEVPITEAFNIGLVVDSKAPVSIQRAIHQGLYDDTTGKITEPNSNKKITLHEAIRKFIINPQLPCYFEPKSERLLNLSDTCRLGIIDRRNGSFKRPIDSSSMSLSQAMESGLIIDIETTGFSLYDAISMGLYDPVTSLFIHPSSCQRLTLAQSCKDELVNPHISLVKSIKSGKYLKLNEAINQNLIEENSALYNLPNGNSINLIEARDKGLIVTTKRPLSLEEAIKNHFYRPDTGKFIEPLTGEFSDLTQSINVNYIDPNITVLKDPVSNELKDLVTAINVGDIDVNKGRVLDTKLKRVYNFDKALERGLLVTLEKPLQQNREIDVTRGTLKDPKVIRECTLEEAIKFELLDPEIAVVKDPQNGRFKPVQQAITDGTLDITKRATFEPQIGKVNPIIIVLEQGTIIFLREPLSFEQALELGYLDVNTGKFTDPQSKEVVTLKEAVTLGLIDPDTALVKDGSKKKMIKLPEAFRRGLMDAEKGNVLDTITSKLYSLSVAIDNGLLFIPSRGLCLIESLTYGLYNPTTGAISNPFDTSSIIDRKRLTLTDAIDIGLIDPTTTVVKDPDTDNIFPLSTAIDNGLIDAIGGRLQDKVENKSMDLIKAYDKGLIVAAEARQAVEEKYKLCDEMLTKLLQWIVEIEEKLSSQDVVREVEEELRNQINTMKQIKDDLEQHAGQVSHCSDQVRQLVLTAGDILSKGEILALEKSSRNLKTRYDKSFDRTERLLRRLLSARDDLVKFKNELQVFSNWLDKARRTLEDKERSLSNLNRLGSSVESTREFVSDVIAHQADLRFITMAAQKFVDESKEYLSVLNEFRTTLPQRLPHIEPLSSQESPVRNEVSLVTAQYRDLLSRANNLSDRLSGVGGRQREYSDAIDKAKQWIKEVEPKANKVISEPIGAEPRIVEEQLNKAKALHNEFVSQGRLIDAAKHALDSLLRSLDGQLSPSEMSALENPVIELTDKYNQLSNALAEKCQELDSALVQSQGVQDALDGLVSWLNISENQFKNIQRPASLIKERLDEQLREHRMYQSEIEMHRASVDNVTLSASELVSSSSNARIAKKIETKLHDVKSRFDKLLDKTIKRGEFLEEVNVNLSAFNSQSTQFEKWYIEIMEIIESRDITKLSIEDYANRMDDVAARRDGKRKLFDETVHGGKDLVGKRDVTDTAPVRDTIKLMESQWKDLNSLLEDKQKLSKLRSEQLNAYESLRDQVLDWLNRTENKVTRLEQVAVESETLKHQNEELKPIAKEYREYGTTVDKVNDLGNMYDTMARGDRPDSPSRRRSQAYSPTKRPSVTASSPLRRLSSDARSPSPTKGGLQITSPVSPGGSSGFSSRRSSQDGFHLEELSPVQQQLCEINNRYSLLGIRINDRQSEIDSIREELRKHMDNLRTLSQFLDKVQRQLPKETIPNTKEEADKISKQIRVILEEMYEKQSLLDSTKSQIKDLIRRKPGAIGADNLNDELEDVVSRWKSINDRCKDRIKFMDDMKEFHDTHDSLSNWLAAKDRMMTVLGPISSDSRMVQSQVQQVQVLREEFRTQQPQLQHLIEVGDNVLARLDPHSPDGQKVNTKLANIQKKWADLLGKLEERADSLGAAADTSRELDAQLTRLRDALQGISDALDELPLDKDPEEQLRKVENLERQLEGQRPLLADAEAAGAQLCEVLSDPASRAEIQGKLAAVGRQYNNLQKKLDHRKAEIEGSLRDGRQFEASCAKTLGWLSDELGSLSERLLISADRDILQQQFDNHEPIYRDVMAREHEVIMLLNKGREVLSKNNKTENRSLQRDIDKIQSHWDKLRKEIVDRHTRLQTCMEHCRKYYRAQEAFLPWLRQAEDKLETLKPASFKKKHMEKQIKELQNFRSDVWKHSGEYENNRMLGDSFLSACDIDKEVVKSELSNMKQRWDKLNNDLMERTQQLEETARRLGDFNENLRDLEHSLQRCEDRLASHDALGGAAKDPKLLDRIRGLRDETVALKRPLQAIRQVAVDFVNEAGSLGVDATHITDEVDNIGDRIDDLQNKLDDRCSDLQSAATAVTQFNDQVKGLSHDLSNLESELDNMKAPGRDFKTLRAQLDEIVKFVHKINKVADDVNRAVHAGENLVDSGFAPDTAQTREQVETLRKQLGRLDDRARNREQDLETANKKLEAFYLAHSSVVEDIQGASEQLRKLKQIGSEVDIIRQQQEDFRRFRSKTVEPLSHNVDECNRLGQALIQSASNGVNTSTLEKDLEKMNEKWNDLKDRMNDRERRLDVGLLQSGKFQEALDGLAKWLTDTEEMVANQKPPSADYKVVKAQLQEQKFLKKMLLDRQNSMSSLFTMGNEIAAEAEPAERKAIERQLKELMGRFDRLTEGAQQRTLDLERAMHVAKQFQDKLVPLQEWLDKTEKKVKDMELIPTDEEKIQQRIREHDALHGDIMEKKPDFGQLTDIASNLMSLVGEDEASALADKLQDVTDRYGYLVDASENLGMLLTNSRQGLRHLVLTYQDLVVWMEGMEQRLSRYRVLAVHTDKLLEQMDDLANLTEEIAARQSEVDSTVDAGLELMKHISSDEALQLKDKLDTLQRRYNDLTSRGADILKHAQEILPLVQQFHNNHNRLVDWMLGAESVLKSAEPHEGDIARLEIDIQEMRPILESINLQGPQLCQASPGEGAATIEGLVTRDNRRFDAIVEQIQRKAERIHLGKQRALEVTTDIDELLEWFREVDAQIRDAEPPSAEPDLIRVQLKEHKALNDDISSQKGRVRDVLSTAKKVLRESPPSEDTSMIREKMEDLRETMDTVSGLSSDRLGILEQALPLAEHFHDTHAGLAAWLDDMEQQVSMLAMPALRPDLIAQQQDRNEMFVQSINEHKPLVDKLNKTGEALIRLCNDDDGSKIQEMLDADNSRYNALRVELRERQQALEQALQESSQFTDKLEGMLRALQNAAEQVHNQEPISAHPPKIRDQIEDNSALVGDLDKRKEAYAAVKRAADDVINKAGNRADPAIKDIKRKLDKLNTLWSDIQKATNDRSLSLEDTLEAAQRFWNELHAIMATLRDLEDNLTSQEPPAVEPKAIQKQQVALQEIRHEIDQTKPEVEQVRASGQELMQLCGEPDKPEVKKHMEDLDHAWDNITALYAKREENLIDAMEKAMEFHETLQDLLEFLDKAEVKFEKMGPLGTDIDAVKKQIEQLKKFKSEVDPHMVKVEALNRQAQELTERTSVDQAAAIKEPLSAVNKRWDDLCQAMVERQRQLENALLRLGQFQHALNELLVWIDKTDNTLDELKPVAGDSQILEVELAKLKVLVNDIQAHQTSVDTLNDAGRQIIESGKGTDEASTTQEKLSTLNRHWRDLLQKAADRQRELEDALRDAQRFHAEIQDLLSWLGDIDGVIASSKPVGGLPETASEQLERFMEVYNELDETRPKVETVLQQGQEYLRKGSNAASNLQHNLRTLKQRWDSVTARANDKKIKLEIALKEATEFHDALQAFVDWLTNAEKVLSNLKPVSRVMDTILSQIEEHKSFQKDVSVHRETMLNLDKKGTHLKYFSQKQDVILIKNLLISVQHRWERVVSKSAERTRALDHGYKEAKEFHDSWSNLMNWLDDTEKSLDELANEVGINDPEKIKTRLAKHQEFHRALSAKQVTYDNTMKAGKQLKERAPKTDEIAIKQMLIDLKAKWTAVCSKSVERQRKLEEALLFSGQFKDAVQALLEWLKKVEKNLAEAGPVHGDLDTVNHLIDQHKSFERDLEARNAQMESVTRTGRELESKASKTDAAMIRSQLNELNGLWDRVSTLTNRKSAKLDEALKEAERLHKAVHMLLEWLSDAEMKLRFAGSMPDNEHDSRLQLAEHEQFLRELKDKEAEKDATLDLAHKILAKAHPDGATVIKHWITIIQTRWEEVSSWALQREQRLSAHMQSMRDLDEQLEELLAWLQGLENTLLALREERLPDDIPILEGLISDHKEFMENTMKRQTEVDRVCKARQIKAVAQATKDPRKMSARNKTPLRGSQHDIRETSPDNYGSLNRRQSFKGSRDLQVGSRKGSRTSPGREVTPEPYPHVGPRFPPKGSKGSEPEFRSPRVKLLWDRWRNVWVLAWERQRALYDKLAYLQEVDKVRNFSWDNWRKRFLKFMNHKKSRLTDLFRKMDKDNNGLIPREDFINGIINTKFDTSRLEMNAVADLFDRNNSHLIDWKEFIAALRPDWEEPKAGNEADKIHDEVKRLVMLCTCRQKFRVFQVGEGKYRFGDSQKLRLVRILRSTVMVRVGGGWVALDEFLLKNDPCRVILVLPIPDPNKPEQHDPWCPYFAKGRTNIELRENFILADGVSQSMTAFKPKTSASQSPASGARTPTTGPITKVRERSARSVPMGSQSRTSRTSLTASTPDSLSDNESGTISRSARKPISFRTTLTPGGSRPGSKPNSRPSSRPASRAGSKPPSRHGSNLSLDSTDDGTPSRIPIHRRMTPTSSRLTGTGTGVAFGSSSSTSRKLNVANGSASSSRPRTPTGLASPTVRPSGIPRASSIPTLTGVATPPRSRIPVYVGTPDNDPESPSTSSGSYSVSFSTGSASTRTSSKASSIPSSIPRSQPTKTRSMSTSNAPVLRTASRTRTPSGSNTPVPPGVTTAASKLTRKASGASDTSTGQARKGTRTPTESRAPFRL